MSHSRISRLILPIMFVTGCLILQPAPAQTTATVSINPNATTITVSPGFLGLSLVTAETKYMAGTPTASNPIFRQLLKNLTNYQNGPLQMRELNDKATNSDTTDAMTTLSNLYNAVYSSNGGVRYFVGVDFSGDVASGGGSNGTAATQAELIYSSLPSGSLLSYEVGNEPDLYESDSPPVRTGTWNYSTYQTQYENTVNSIEAKNTGIPMDAPVFSGGSNGFSTNINAFITAEEAHLGLFDLHYYAGNHCNGNSVAGDYLMTDAAVNSTAMVSRPDNVSGYLTTLHSVGRSNFRIGEMNSIACQGQEGVSDTFQSALWFLDEAMNYATQYVSGINVFTLAAASYYSPFQFNNSGTYPNYTYTVSRINPIYYGMLTEALVLQDNGALLPVTLSTSYNIKAYATKDSAGNVRLLLINKEETSSGDGNVSVSMSGGGNASLWNLLVTNDDYQASDYTNYSGSGDEVTLAGQTFKGSTDGTLQGTQTLPTVVPSGGVYTIPLPHCSAVIVKIP